MNVGRRNFARTLAAAGIVAFLAFLLLVAYAPDAVPYSPNNYGWNGIEGVSSAYNVVFASSLASLPSGRTVLVELQPTTSFSPNDVKAVARYVSGGGTLLVADSSGDANGLLQGLGTGITIEDQLAVNDPIYNWKAPQLPVALAIPGKASSFPFMKGVQEIALNEPSPLGLSLTENSTIAITSPMSFDVNRTAEQTALAALGAAPPDVSTGQFAIAAADRMGSGTIVVVGDSQLLTNSGWNVADNRVLLNNLFANSTVVIDASHWTTSPLTSSTAQLKGHLSQAYQTASASPMRYILTAGFVAVSIALVPEDEKRQMEEPAKIEEGSTSFNREAMDRVRKDRERYAGKHE